MKKLQELLQKENYKKIKFKVTKTQHLTIKASINGVQGDFILDTGASNSCVGFESIELFKLKANNSKTKASGAGATGMMTQIAKKNHLKIGSFFCMKIFKKYLGISPNESFLIIFSRSCLLCTYICSIKVAISDASYISKSAFGFSQVEFSSSVLF